MMRTKAVNDKATEYFSIPIIHFTEYVMYQQYLAEDTIPTMNTLLFRKHNLQQYKMSQ